jgi:adenine-specific DNA-methyltransferase
MMKTLDLFESAPSVITKTEGIKYAGSKKKLLPHIICLINRVNPRTVLDGFSGTTRVSQALAQCGYSVIANDHAVWSETFGICYLLNKLPMSHYVELINHLNNIPPEDGWFTENYGGSPDSRSSVGVDGLKKPWQIHNTRRLDAIRNEIDSLNLTLEEKSVLLTSLIYALDDVDSTLGHFASYLNEWSVRSYKKMRLTVPNLILTSSDHKVYRKNIFDILPDAEVDLAYFDPPYGSNNEKMPPSRVRYAAYYHIWTTICLNDKPELFGKVRRRVDSSDTLGHSDFEQFRRDEKGRYVAVETIREMLRLTKARNILLSYSSGGRATAEELHEVISETGRLIDVVEVDYKRNVMAAMRWTNEWIRDSELPNREFLFLIEKR